MRNSRSCTAISGSARDQCFKRMNLFSRWRSSFSPETKKLCRPTCAYNEDYGLCVSQGRLGCRYWLCDKESPPFQFVWHFARWKLVSFNECCKTSSTQCFDCVLGVTALEIFVCALFPKRFVNMSREKAKALAVQNQVIERRYSAFCAIKINAGIICCRYSSKPNVNQCPSF